MDVIKHWKRKKLPISNLLNIYMKNKSKLLSETESYPTSTKKKKIISLTKWERRRRKKKKKKKKKKKSQ